MGSRRCWGGRPVGHIPHCNTGSPVIEAQEAKASASKGRPCSSSPRTCHLHVTSQALSEASQVLSKASQVLSEASQVLSEASQVLSEAWLEGPSVINCCLVSSCHAINSKQYAAA